MKFDYISDVHDDFWRGRELVLENPENIPTLVVGGDLSNNRETTTGILNKYRKVYDNVLFVDGNHDHYGNNQDKTWMYFHNRLSKIGVSFLPASGRIINGVLFIGTNGWYDFRSCEDVEQNVQKERWHQFMADARVVDFTERQPEELAEDDSIWLSACINDAQENVNVDRIVVVTHSVPLRRFVVGPDHRWYNTNGSFHSTLLSKCLTHNDNDKIKMWLFGHTHFTHHAHQDGVEYICNPRGYPGERNKWLNGNTEYGPLTLEV